MISTYKINFFQKNDNLFSIFLICLINFLYFILTYDNPWTLDDFGLIFPVKLFNIINNYNFTFQTFIFSIDSTSYVSANRYLPLYDFFNQFLPTNAVLFHFFVSITNTLCAIVIYFISKKIFLNNYLSLFTSIFFSINFSISIKMLTWNLFYNHLLASFFGFLAIYFFINLQKNKWDNIFFILISVISFLISEVGLIFPILSFALYFLFFNKKNLKEKIFISSIPLIIFITISYINSGKLLPLFEERLKEGTTGIENIFNPDNKNELYFNRSTYAPRNPQNYSIRLIDNTAASLNLSSIEKVLKFIDKNDKIKNYLKKNYKIFYILFIILITILLIFILKQKYSSEQKKKLLSLFLFYFLNIFIFTFVFFRRDINLALSFSSALLIAYLFKIFYEKKLKTISLLILSIFLLPTILYYFTKFEYTMTDLGPRSSSKAKIENIINQIKTKKFNQFESTQKNLTDFKYLYYYYNKDKNKDDLIKDFKNLNYPNFTKKFRSFNFN